MNIKDFYETVRENVFQTLDFYRVQRESSGEKYINSPIKSRQAIIDELESEINDPWEDIDDYTEEEDRILLEKVKIDVLAEYDAVIKNRKAFMESLHPEEEYVELFED